ncbi:MAG: cytochrome C [Sulfurimonas sp.]|nr:MAG: cytochrome C [Sulfurimonas sp.]
MQRYILSVLFFTISLYSSEIYTKKQLTGKEVFETYCWGCHHQTAMAFGPPFSEIAAKRTYEEIQAYIIDPELMYKSFGYKRSAMSKLKTTQEEREAVAKYILSYKGK